MKKMLCITLWFWGILCGYSQQPAYPCSADSDYQQYLLTGLTGYEYINPVAEYSGEQYFNFWKHGQVTLTNGERINDILLRYDRFLDALLWMKENESTIRVLSKFAVKSFSIPGEKGAQPAVFWSMKVSLPGVADKLAFLQLLAEGTLSVYVARNSAIKSTSENVLEDNTSYYMKIGNTIYPLALRRHSLLDLPGIDKMLMKSVIRSNGLAISGNEAGLVRAVTEYNRKQASSQR